MTSRWSNKFDPTEGTAVLVRKTLQRRSEFIRLRVEEYHPE